MAESKPTMEYRHLGPTGLKVSAISYGNWVTADDQAQEKTNELVKKAWDCGINFFDTAEGYGKYVGEGEEIFGKALKALNVPREDLVISTKIFFGSKTGQINRVGCSRKHIIEGTLASLKRLQLDYVDVIFCHRYDEETPIEETVRAMNWLITNNKAFYWGTSEWTSEQIRKAFEVCEKLGLAKPVVEQPQYNMLVRDNFEKNLHTLFEEYKLGTTIWSPLAGGILTGKYRDGIPKDSRIEVTNAVVKSFYDKYIGPENKDKVNALLNQLEEVAKSLGATLPQFALAWALYNKNVSTALIGASKTSQIDENVKAIEVYRKITPEIEEKVENILKNRPDFGLNFKTFSPFKAPARR